MMRRFLFPLLLVLSSTTTAHAQTTPGLSNSIRNMLNQMGNPPPASTTPGPGTPPASGATAPGTLANLDFKPNAQLRQKAIKTFVDSFRAQAPQVATELEASLAKVDIFAEADKETRKKFGVGINNMADMMAVYFAYTYLVSQGSTDDPTQAQIHGISRQLKTIFAKSSPPLTEVQKQETADALTLQTVFIGMITEVYQNEPDQLRAFGQALVENWKAQGLDLSQMTLTDDGFVRQP